MVEIQWRECLPVPASKNLPVWASEPESFDCLQLLPTEGPHLPQGRPILACMRSMLSKIASPFGLGACAIAMEPTASRGHRTPERTRIERPRFGLELAAQLLSHLASHELPLTLLCAALSEVLCAFLSAVCERPRTAVPRERQRLREAKALMTRAGIIGDAGSPCVLDGCTS
eukprot:scaffold1169_cov245-Pinguiococcus_pyrenoidosus.AAC.2